MRTMQIKAAQGTLTLSKIVMGSTYYGGAMDRAESFSLLDLYYKLGGRTIDTARSYSQTEFRGMAGAEAVIGAWLRERGARDEITLVTKGVHYGSLTPKRITPQGIREDVGDSLRCLGVESVDLYLLHRDDPDKPVGPLIEELHRHVEAGELRAIGASNWTTARIAAANDYAAQHRLTPFTVSQIQWSLAASDPQSQNDPTLVCMNEQIYREYGEMGMPVMAFASQAKGLYSKYIAGGLEALTEKSRRFFSPENLAKAEAVKEIAARRGVSPAAVVLGYITCNPLPGCAIIGCSSAAQLEDSMSAQNLVLTAEEIERLQEGV